MTLTTLPPVNAARPGARHPGPAASGRIGARQRPELAEARVDLDAIAANTRWFAGRAAGASLMAVVKADAFGHGAVPVAAAALSAGATWLGVARLREGLELRAAGITAPVLAWLLEPACLAEAIEAGIDVSASSTGDLDRIVHSGAAARPDVHLKLDTGLHRAGVPVEDWPQVVARAAELERRGRLRVRGVWSHLSHGDVAGHARNHAQQAALASGVGVARSAGLEPEVTHLANSGGVIQLGHAACSMVRVGAGLYGIDPLAGHGPARRLQPAMTVTAQVIGVRTVGAGEGIGYGHAGVTRRPTRLALVPVGYADGIPRVAAGRARMLVSDTLVPVVGRVSMDQVILDVGALPVRDGDRVVVFGDGSDGAPTVADWATWAATIPHEVLTGIGGRVSRRTAGRSA